MLLVLDTQLVPAKGGSVNTWAGARSGGDSAIRL